MNIFWILEDALRPDHMGCYGYDKDTTPNCDRLAREGVRFDWTIAPASHTLPPIVSMLMGQWPATHGVVNPQRFVQWHKLPRSGMETALELLEKAGYLVDGELVTRWRPLGFKRDTPGNEITQYFERHRDDRWFFYAEPYPTHLPYDPPDAYYQRFLDEPPDADTLRRLQIARKYLIVHPTGVISKLEAGEEDPLPDANSDQAHRRSAAAVDLKTKDRPAINALYDGEVRVFDDLVGRWLGVLESLGILDDTLVILTADHGEELMERGHIGHCSCNLMGTLYDESIRVPLILRYPKRLPQDTVIETQVSHIDIMPTVFDLLDMPQPAWMEGRSLLPLVNGQTAFREEAYSETTPAGWQALSSDDRQIYAVRTATQKLILYTDGRRSSRRYEFFDLAHDPGETTNLFDRSPAEAAILIEWLNAYSRRTPRCKSWP